MSNKKWNMGRIFVIFSEYLNFTIESLPEPAEPIQKWTKTEFSSIPKLPIGPSYFARDLLLFYKG
jgi:hypothetical protein